MALTKQQTDLLIIGNSQEFWRFLSEQNETYELTADEYDDICTIVENGETEGTNGNGSPMEIEGYPVRQRPPIRPSY